MPVRAHHSPETPASAPRGAEDEISISPELWRLLLPALRFAATLEEAPSRCSRRECRRSRRCRAALGADGEPECHAGIDGRMIDRAAGMVAFLHVLGKPEWWE